MSLTRKQAVQEMVDVFKPVWDGTGFGSRVKYQNVGTTNTPPPGQDPWIRFTVQHAAGDQATLGGIGNRRFRHTGTLVLSLFEPVGRGLFGVSDLGTVLAEAFEGASTPGGICFLRVQPIEVGSDGDFFQTNITIDFEYDEVR